MFVYHWTANDLKVAGHKSITIIWFFLSEIIFREKMVSLSNNDRFDNDKIFLCNIWHFSIITGINYVSVFFVFILIYLFFAFIVVGYYTWTALVLLVISMFFTHVVIFLKIWYVISDKQKYISLVVVVVVVALVLVLVLVLVLKIHERNSL